MYKPKKEKKKDLPCKATQIRNPDTGNCKECMGFTVDELIQFAQKIGVVVERGDLKQDLCNKIFYKVGLRGQNLFDRIISGVIGIPPVAEQVFMPAAPAFPPGPMLAVPAQEIRQRRMLYKPVLTISERTTNYPENVVNLLLENAKPVVQWDEAVQQLGTNLEQIFRVFDGFKLTLSLLDAEGKKIIFKDPQGKDRDIIGFGPVLKSIVPKAKTFKPSVLLINDPNGKVIGVLKFQILQEEEGLQIPAKGEKSPEELAEELELMLLLGEEIQEEKASKKRGL